MMKHYRSWCEAERPATLLNSPTEIHVVACNTERRIEPT
jgi:hypothetical protein